MFYSSLGIGMQKLRDIWSNRQVISLGEQNEAKLAKANWILPRECSVREKTLFQQHKKWLYTWTSPNGQYRNKIDCILCSRRWRSCILSTKTRPGADCGSGHLLLIAKFRLKLKKTRKNTRPARNDLNQILYEFIVEMMNRFKGLDLVSRCLKNCGQRSVMYRRQWTKPSPQKEWEGYVRLNSEFQRTARRDKKAFFNEQCLIIEENNKGGKTWGLYRNIGNIKGAFCPKVGTVKGK